MELRDKHTGLVELERLRQSLAPDGGCLMCALVRGGANPKPVAELERAIVVVDRFGRREGHLLVVTKAHLELVLELDWETHLQVQRLVFEARRALQRVFSPVQVFACAFGATAPVPMSFAHHHVHVIPVCERDERARPARVLSWTEGVVTYSDAEAEHLRQRLSEVWAPFDAPEKWP